ncbi:MAG: ATP-binding protein [Bacteroidota bacterium]
MTIIRRSFFFQILFIAGAIFFLPSCTSKNNSSKSIVRHCVQIADSLALIGNPDSARHFLFKQRSKFKNNDPNLCVYYDFMVLHNKTLTPLSIGQYADSALAIFNNAANVKKYPNDYFKALLTKGDACIIAKQFETALSYYDKAKKLLTADSCDNGSVASKMALIYFKQQNYHRAAKYWVESYDRLLACQSKLSPQRLFFTAQGILDNIGLAYQQNGMYDSAAYYYKKDIAYIDKTEATGNVDKNTLVGPRVVVYDNIGGLYLKQGNLTDAEKYLSLSLSLPVVDVNGMRITPFIKRGYLYLKTRHYPKAAADFKQSRQLLNLYGKVNAEAELEWNQLYAQYLYAQHQTDSAFQYQTKYIQLKDSLDKANTKLRVLDVDRELNSINRENLLAELEHNDKLEKLFLLGVTILVIFLFALSLFINRVLKESRKNHYTTRLHNEQLQQAMSELENANKNIVRIMRIMAHDLRNPLSGMIGLANAIIEDESSDENKHMLKLLEATGVHSLEMINELLKYGLADENETVSKQELDLKELLRDSVELLQFKANEKKQQIIFDSDDKPIITQINHEKIWRVFNNLIVNAIKFSYEKGVIQVGIKTKGKKILISIADNGIGIPDRDKDKIFDMFTTAKKSGTNGEQPFGLGLSISKRIIENHNGKIWFESVLDVGTTFYIELPLKNA